MQKDRLQKYAHLIARCGLNVQPGQEVFITAALDQPEFVRMTAEECYKLGAKRVVTQWKDQALGKLAINYQTTDTLAELTPWEDARWKYMAEQLPCRLFIDSDDPDGLNGIDQEKYAEVNRRRYPLIRAYRDQMENRHQWCIAAVPGPAWAAKVFPELSAQEAEEKLWEAILDTSRVDDDPVAAWKAHNEDVARRCAWLNGLGIEKLHYMSANGTDFTVGMIPQGRFCGGGETDRQGIFFNPNIPSEECFTSPMRGQADGWVVATKPLSLDGQLVEDFRIRFENGKAVEWHAAKNEDVLTHTLQMDEGSAYLGECALVPYDSPIQNTGMLFFNTLFDENAACHLALGTGFPDCINGFEELSLEACRALGVNKSMIHVDFMIGSADMRIDAITRDGRTVPVFVNGNWAD